MRNGFHTCRVRHSFNNNDMYLQEQLFRILLKIHMRPFHWMNCVQALISGYGLAFLPPSTYYSSRFGQSLRQLRRGNTGSSSSLSLSTTMGKRRRRRRFEGNMRNGHVLKARSCRTNALRFGKSIFGPVSNIITKSTTSIAAAAATPTISFNNGGGSSHSLASRLNAFADLTPVEFQKAKLEQQQQLCRFDTCRISE